jgi:hypothetical protein
MRKDKGRAAGAPLFHAPPAPDALRDNFNSIVGSLFSKRAQ